MSLRKQIPPRDLPWIDEKGRPTDLFFDYIKNLESRSLGQGVILTDTPANGETLLFSTTTDLWEFGAN